MPKNITEEHILFTYSAIHLDLGAGLGEAFWGAGLWDAPPRVLLPFGAPSTEARTSSPTAAASLAADLEAPRFLLLGMLRSLVNYLWKQGEEFKYYNLSINDNSHEYSWAIHRSNIV